MVSGLGDYRLTTLAAVSGTATGLVCLLFWYKRRGRNQPPKTWTKVGSVKDLYLYPVKSCKGLRQTELECTALGSKVGELRDRMFVVVDENGKFVTGRDYPRMIQIHASVESGRLRLSAPEVADAVEFDFHNLRNEPQTVRIWGALAEGYDCGDEAATWISRFINQSDTGFRLLYYGDRTEAMEINPSMQRAIKFNKNEFKKTDAALFSDAAAFHLISEASVKELNSRLPNENVSPLNFRPNIVVEGEGLLPFEEDHWNWLKIGDVVFRLLAPCGRCVFTTIDPATQTKSKDYEPVNTLKRYRLSRDPEARKVFQSPAMGIYLGARTFGNISVGDDVMIPAKYNFPGELLANTYANARVSVQLNQNTSDFPTTKGVRQEDAISPKLLTLTSENVFRKGLNNDGEYLSQFRFADDVVLIASCLSLLQQMLGCIAVASAIALVAVISFFTRSRKRRIPNKWTEIGYVSHLRVYPLKSGKGIACESLTCTESGVATEHARDRMFLVVDSHGKCISGREYPRITQVAAEVRGSRLKLSGLEINPLEVDIPSTGVPVRLRIWGACAEGLDCGREASEWLTTYLGSETPVRLLYRGENVAAKDYIPHMKKLLEMTGTVTYKTDTRFGIFLNIPRLHSLFIAAAHSVGCLGKRISEQIYEVFVQTCSNFFQRACRKLDNFHTLFRALAAVTHGNPHPRIHSIQAQGNIDCEVGLGSRVLDLLSD